MKESIEVPNEYKWFNPEDILHYLNHTTEESWCTDVVKTKAGQSCMFGHIFDWGNKIGGNKTANQAMDIFENAFATTYMVYPVNDGKHIKYQQSTPKQRCIAYFEDLINGNEPTTWELMQ